MSIKIVGRVDGTIRFPDHPEHQGEWGLIGGDDVVAYRDTFRSIGEAMTWCRMVLDGRITPRWICDGEILKPHTPPLWSEARVKVQDHHYDVHVQYYTSSGRRTWHKEVNDRFDPDDVARTDWDLPS